MKKVLLFLLVGLLTLQASAQRQRNYIYVLDCTGSIQFYKLTQPAVDFMRADLGRLDENCSVVILPFQQSVNATYKADTGEEAVNIWNKTIESKYKDEWVHNTTQNTNILGAYKEALKHIDANKDNYVYLMTDGKNTYPANVTMEDVARFMQEQCGKFENTHFYYVMLSKQAVDQNITRVADVCDDWSVIEPGEFGKPFGKITPNKININIYEINEKTYSLPFSTYGTYKVNVNNAYPHLGVQVVDNAIKDGKIKFKFVNKYGSVNELHSSIGQENDNFTFKVVPQGNNLNLLQGEVKVNVINHAQRSLTFKELGDIGKAEWYDSFLFWGEKDADTINCFLEGKFNEFAVQDKSSLRIKVVPGEGDKKDYQLYYNGKLIEDEFTVNAEDEIQMLSVVFNKDAKDGDKHFELRYAGANKLEMVNDNETNAFEAPFYAHYDVVMNPLKKFLIILGIIIVALLVLWFLVIKPIYFPTFRVGRMMITDPYYSNKSIHGVRRVVFTNRTNAKDNFIKALFSGKTIYEIGSVWTDEWEMKPGLHRTCRPLFNGNYSLDPFATGLVIGGEYEITNLKTNEKAKITIN